MKTLKTMFVAGWLAVLVCPGWAAAAPGAEKTWNAEAGDYFTPRRLATRRLTRR